MDLHVLNLKRKKDKRKINNPEIQAYIRMYTCTNYILVNTEKNNFKKSHPSQDKYYSLLKKNSKSETHIDN